MRYLIFVIDRSTETASGNEMAAIDAFNEMLEANGHWITASGIHHGANAFVIDNRNGAGMLERGSIQETPEHYSGYWLIEADDLETAKRLASEGSKACNRKVELRPDLRHPAF
jgi:hypothetical protein